MGNISVQQFRKNFFYSADSEHYQDAVLTYIFYNYPKVGKQDKDLSEIERFSKFFTKKLLNKKGINITGIEVETQIHDSDIDLIVHTSDGKDHLVIIEDKTGSSVHCSVKKQKNSKDKNSETIYYNTQLEKYFDKFLHDNKYENYFKEGRVHLFYYKNEYVSQSEINIIDSANEDCKKLLDASFDSQMTKWMILNIHWIFDTFNEFYKGNESKNIILRDYFESIKYWKTEIDTVLSNNYKINRASGDDIKWGDKSKLWNPVFCQMIEDTLDKIGDYETKVQPYTGRYWEMAIHARDRKTCMLATSKGIKNKSFSICINLRNAKYNGEDGVPEVWNKTKGAREEEGNRIIDFVKANKIDGATIKPGSEMTTEGRDNNKICTYEFKFKPGEKADYDTLFKYWMKVVEFFVNNIDGI